MNAIFVSSDAPKYEAPVLDRSHEKILRILESMYKRKGESVIYTRRENRIPIIQLWDIDSIRGKFVNLRRECYAPDGSFRQYRYTSASFQSLYCGDEIIEFLPEGF